MCFVWISEKPAIISLYSFNWLVLQQERGVFTAQYELKVKMFCGLIFVFKWLINKKAK
jgi:hypothetical protein